MKVGTVCVASKPGGRKDGNEYCSPEIGLSSEAVEEVIALRRPGSRIGKAAVWWEETVKCATGAAGAWVLASRERFSEITSGRSYFQLGWQQPAKTLLIKLIAEIGGEDLGPAHVVVVAKREG